METKAATYRLPDETLKKIDELSETMGVSKTEVVIRMVAHFEGVKALPEPVKVATAAEVTLGVNRPWSYPKNLYPPGQHPLGWNQIMDLAGARRGLEPI